MKYIWPGDGVNKLFVIMEYNNNIDDDKGSIYVTNSLIQIILSTLL